jgi:hypothetical protein
VGGARAVDPGSGVDKGAWRAAEGYFHREMIDAMLYIDDNGTK